MCLNLAVIAVASLVIVRQMTRPKPPPTVGELMRVTRVAADEHWEKLVREGGRLGEGGPLVVEFFDYQCPFCRMSHDSLTRAPGPAHQVLIRHRPMPEHAHAEAAARASICAERRGVFRALHAYLLEDDEWMEGPDWSTVSREIGLGPGDSLEECMYRDETTARLSADTSLANLVGVRGTPTWVSETGVHIGLINTTALRALVGDLPLPSAR